MNAPRTPVTYTVNADSEVLGLPGRDRPRVLFFRYPDGDVDYPSTPKQMHAALYDLFQVEDGLHDGDRFETPFGVFVCRGVHVLAE